MIENLKQLWAFRQLLSTLVVRHLRIRYKNSALGFLWSLVVPMVTVAVLTIVFKRVMGMAIPNYSAYVLAAYLPWMCIQSSVMDSAQSVLEQIQLVKKVYFPREILPLSNVLANLVHFLLAMLVFFLYLILYVKAPLIPTMLWFPVLVLLQTALVTGLSLLVSCLNVFYEDTKYVVMIALQLLFYMLPVIYFSEQVWNAQLWPWLGDHGVYYLYHLNPIAMLLTAYRKLLLQPIHATTGAISQHRIEPLPLDPWLSVIAIATSLGLLALGYWYFKKRDWEFAERL